MNHFLLRICRRVMPRVLGLHLVGAFVLAALFSACSAVEAAPVTFAFEAEVASVIEVNWGAGVPFAVNVDDVLVSSFELDSFSGGPQRIQTGALSFEVAGYEFSLTGFVLTVENDDAPDAIPLRGRLAAPLNTPIVDQAPGITDSLFFSCIDPFDLSCGSLAGNEDIVFGPRIALIGDRTVHASTELTTDLTIWNAFSFRELVLLFRNESTGGTTRIGAYVGSVSQIPEPASGILAILCGVLVLLFDIKRQQSQNSCESMS